MFLLASLDSATWALVGVTAALVVVTAILAVSTWRNATKAGEAAEAAVRTAKAAEADLAQGATLVRVGQDQVATAQAQVASAQTQATAALEQSEIARQTLEASFRPMLVPILVREVGVRRFQALDGISVEVQTGPEPKCWIGLDKNQVERFFAVIPLRNVGPGPAILSTNIVDAWFAPYFSGAQRLYARPSSPIVATGDTVDFVFYGLVDDFTRSVASAAPGTSRQATFSVRYFDVAQSYATNTSLRLGSLGATMLSVEEVDVELRDTQSD